MAKRGQFYLFLAVILSVIVYGLFSGVSFPKNKIRSTENLRDNYFYEAENAINSAIYDGRDLYESVDNYTLNFIDYSSSKNTEFKILYLLKHADQIRVANYLKTSIIINNTGLDHNNYITLNKSDTIIIKYKENEYNYTFNDDDIQFKALVLES